MRASNRSPATHRCCDENVAETIAVALQLDSNDNVPHMFGDVGCGHIMQCPDHPDVLTFAWACS